MRRCPPVATSCFQLGPPRRRLRNLLEGCEAALFASTVTRRITVIVFAAIAVHVILFAVYCSLVLGSRCVCAMRSAAQTPQ